MHKLFKVRVKIFYFDYHREKCGFLSKAYNIVLEEVMFDKCGDIS